MRAAPLGLALGSAALAAGCAGSSKGKRGDTRQIPTRTVRLRRVIVRQNTAQG